MTLQELANKENELCSKVIDLFHRTRTEDTDRYLREIFVEYKKIHRTYANLSHNEIEALKRGLFIQWYALTEPNYLTGISDLDENAQNELLEVLYELVQVNKMDFELIWMLNYYSNWNWTFEIHKSFKGFDRTIVNEQNSKLPEIIDRKAMKLRGQMGKYRNSLTIFKKA
jgi:hypothetical protein